MKRFLIIACALITLSITHTYAQADEQLLDAITSDSATPEQWAQAMTNLADTEKRPHIETALKKRKHFPKKQLVTLLTHPQLSTRLGAIELLEDASGGDYSYNAWLNPTDDTNQEPLEMWTTWANNTSLLAEQKSASLSPEKIQTYIQQLISDNRSKITRATRMLEGDNFNAVAAIQQFILKNPTLNAAKIAQLKQAQYELVLIKTAQNNASQLARDLVKGNRDQKLIALAGLKNLGVITIPIIRDYVDDQDPLTRETAVDAILTVGGVQVLPFITDQLKRETDINVIHVALKNLKDISDPKSLEIVRSFLTHPDEDLVIASIGAMGTLMGVDDSNGLMPSIGTKKNPSKNDSLEIVKLLKDSRWRVRIAALEHAAKMTVREAAPDILDLLENDADEFVRHNAIKTAVSLKLTEAKPLLMKLYKSNDDMVPSLTEAIISLDSTLPTDLLDHLKTRDADIIIPSLKAFSASTPNTLHALIHFANSNDIDIACAALRYLSDDEDKTKQAMVANTLTDAITSKNTEKISAILNSLDIPANNSTSPALRYLNNTTTNSTASNRPTNTSLDALYNHFLLPGGKPVLPDSIDSSNAATSTGGITNLVNTIYDLAKSQPSTEQSFKIALLLTKAGDKRGLALIDGNVSEMPISKRAALAEALYNPRQQKSVPIILALLQDPSKDIRTKAISAAFRNENNKVLIHSALNALLQKDTKITGADAYSYSTDNAAGDASTRTMFHQWCTEQLNKPELNDQTKILSLVLLRKMATSSDNELISSFTTNINPWVRRAAWHTLGTINSSWYEENISKLLADPHPDVRAALADCHTRAGSAWNFIFSDTETRGDSSYYSNKNNRRISEKIEAALQEMAKSDTSPKNRFEAMFTLLSHSRTINLQRFINHIPQQGKESDVTYRLSNYVQSNYARMGKGMRPLLAYVDFNRISKSYHSRINQHFGTDSTSDKNSGAGFTTFNALAKTSDASEEPQHLTTPEDDQNTAKREKLVIIFFEKTGCKKCLEVETYLKNLKQDFPLLEINRQLVDSSDGLLLNNHLSNKLQVPANQIGKAPAIYTSHGYLVGTYINPRDLAKLLADTMATPEQPDWHSLEKEADIQLAKQAVDKSYSDLTLPIVIAGGLLDGINPCAFATIIFFLSYLTIAKRSAKEIFFVGFAFILAVFLSYLSFGLLFSKALEWLTANTSYQWIRSALNYIFAGFSLLVAILSLRDWWRARQGRLQDMTLQLPSFLKNKIRSVIRENSKSSLYILAAFGSGIAISVLELACTGQVYAPIIYKINEGNQDAVTMLVIYNLAFVLPLIIIFALAMGGMKSNALINFQKNHTSKIKLLTAILFFALAAILLFSTQLSAWAESFYPSL
ncbi:MAG: HEAT repeat domain-containing protein [Akkermansiaceae bacterium]